MKDLIYPRHVDAGDHFESFLVAAVTAILGIRAFLHLTGYPTVGGEALHVAHMLWGGLLMLVALLLLLGFLGNGVRAAAAVIGGAGFGTFIDELGKFLTHDNDYFFEPTAALIYVLLVLTYVGVHTLHRRGLTPRENLANALELTHESVRHELDEAEKVRALDLLRRSDAGHPIVVALMEALERTPTVEVARPGPLARTRAWVRQLYQRLVRRRWFTAAVIAFFVAQAVLMLSQTMALVQQAAGFVAVLMAVIVLGPVAIREFQSARVSPARVLSLSAAAVLLAAALIRGAVRLPDLSFHQWGELAGSALPALLVVLGAARMTRSRLAGYRTFRQAVLIIIFVGQFFAFYHDQFLAIFGLAWYILILATLRYVIHQEESPRYQTRATAAPAAAT